MRNIITREGYEFWDKICAVQSYAFLLSPDGRRVVKTPDIGDWIDKHEAQVIVDHAQEDFNVMKDELAALREELATANGCLEEWRRSKLGQTITENMDLREELAGANRRLGACINQIEEQQQRLAAAEQRNSGMTELLRMVQKASRKQGWAFGYPELFNAVDAALTKPTESGASE